MEPEIVEATSESIKVKCPKCGFIGSIDKDQFQGNVSIDCPNCRFHETHNLESEVENAK